MTYQAQRTPGKPLEHDEIVSMLSDVSKKLYDRLTADRFVSKQTDAAYLAMVRAWGTITNTLYTIQRDEEIDELRNRIEALEDKHPRQDTL